MALGSAAVLAVYAAGYLRTKPAADQLESQSSMRSMRRPFPPTAGAQGAPARAAAAQPLNVALQTAASDSAAATVIAAAAAAAPQPATMAMKATPGTAGGTMAPTSPASVASSEPAVARDSTVKVTSTVLAASPAVTEQPVPSEPAPPPVASLPAAPAPSTPAAAPTPAPAAASSPAAAPAPAAAAAKTTARATYKDGLFFGRGTSRHGDIESMIEIKDGRIISAVISQCLTQYTCRWIAALPGQVLARQSPDVDYVTGATESANAFYFSIVQALMQAK